MSTGTLTRADLSDSIHRKVGLSKAEASDMVEHILACMCGALSDGEQVKLSGFGTFLLRDKGERIGRNPKTGVEVPITPRRVMTFRASQAMRERIAQGN
ncbi:integration host factor subunit alpha [Sphingorhabdus soli]|uniref:Integration host factor subunit alpha n=1 Tax=Flavisphingopyxis soli TaxID=2601267 RepID=A0A5C6UL14_9SPHN|nr:integration host factor subunit alpha [Sphingorhabdus soli]TXC73872.1 integration host factor subunit alpha [Sphingorhabdus soli]